MSENSTENNKIEKKETTQTFLKEEPNTTQQDTIKENPEKFLNEFNWSKFEEGIDEIDPSHLKEYDELIDANFTDVKEQDVIVGTVTKITEREAIIDIDSKSEGIISLNEFRYNPDLKIGDAVDVLIDQREDASGQLILSHRKARVIKAWDRVINAYENEEIVNGFVKCRTKGGMIVNVFGIETFLPGSQIDVKPIRDYDQYVNKTMEFKIVKINHEFKNVVISHKALIEADLADQKREIMSQLEKGQVIEGVVKNITSYGVFVDLGGVDGLIHITDISWSRVTDPSEVLELDQKIKVVILDFDEEKTRIQLGLKQLEKHPWELLDPNLKEGDKIKGKVVVIADYGAFVEIAKNVEGLVHVSEMSWSTHLHSAQDFVKIGDEVEAVILSISREDKKISLGMKQLAQDPWTGVASKYPIGSVHKGTVRNFTNFGVFLELEEGVDGLIHISDISWTKKIKHPSEFVHVGDKLDVVVLDLDVENRKLSIGHKQTKENPWNIYEDKYTVGSKHEGVLTKLIDKGKGGIIEFTENEDVSAFIPSRLLTRADGTKVKKGDKDEYRVIEFNKDFKKIVVSHASIKSSKSGTYNEKIATSNKQNEKTTLGDLNILADLRKGMKK